MDQWQPQEILGVLYIGKTGEECRTCHGVNEWMRDQFGSDVRVDFEAVDADHFGIGLAAQQIRARQCRLQDDLTIAETALQLRQPGEQALLGDAWNTPQRQAATEGRADVVIGLAHDVECAPDLGVKRVARGCQQQTTAPRLDQDDIEIELQISQMSRNDCRTDGKLLAGRLDTARPRKGVKGSQRVEGRKAHRTAISRQVWQEVARPASAGHLGHNIITRQAFRQSGNCVDDMEATRQLPRSGIRMTARRASRQSSRKCSARFPDVNAHDHPDGRQRNRRVEIVVTPTCLFLAQLYSAGKGASQFEVEIPAGPQRSDAVRMHKCCRRKRGRCRAGEAVADQTELRIIRESSSPPPPAA
jgi:hypothetical protein